MPVAPSSTSEVFVACGCGTSANETAFKLAFDNYYINNPNGPEPAILSFKGSFHGRLYGTLTATYSKPIHKVGIKTYDWLYANMPELKYPYAENESFNQQQEQNALHELEKLFVNPKKPIAGAIIEPIQSEGGDRSASPGFYIGIQEIFKKHGVVFIVDEVQTGCGGTGKFWGHEHWGPRADPDIVTFAKKLQVSGLFHKSYLRPRTSNSLFNPFHSDHVRLLNFKAINNVIQEDKLLRRVQDTGRFIKTGLRNIQKKTQIDNVRGQGTLIAFDMPTPALAMEFIKEMAKVGINVGTCGIRSIRLRPSLIFQTKHAEILLDRIEFVLNKLNKK